MVVHKKPLVAAPLVDVGCRRQKLDDVAVGALAAERLCPGNQSHISDDADVRLFHLNGHFGEICEGSLPALAYRRPADDHGLAWRMKGRDAPILHPDDIERGEIALRQGRVEGGVGRLQLDDVRVVVAEGSYAKEQGWRR
jgi:hypothetical protein